MSKVVKVTLPDQMIACLEMEANISGRPHAEIIREALWKHFCFSLYKEGTTDLFGNTRETREEELRDVQPRRVNRAGGARSGEKEAKPNGQVHRLASAPNVADVDEDLFERFSDSEF